MTTPDLLTVPAAPELAPALVHNLRAWLRLAHARGLRPIELRALLGEFGGPEAVLDQSFGALAAVAGESAAKAVLAPPPRFGHGFEEYVQRAADWASMPGNHVITLADIAYPRALLTMPDPPPLLYIKGRLDLLQARAVAIVGSRGATPQGIEDARRFARALSDAGLTVVSGLALGIDAAAHGGALDGFAGTIAVIGTGADLVYPQKNHPLAHRIAEDGAIVSEWPLGTPARSENFPQRNRLIAGLVEGVLIVEAAMRSGSLITARLANEMGRDVFAIPGSIHAPLARGCHRMIKQGAKLVETPEDVLEEFGVLVDSDAPRHRFGDKPARSRKDVTTTERRAAETGVAATAIRADQAGGSEVGNCVRAASGKLKTYHSSRARGVIPGNCASRVGSTEALCLVGETDSAVAPKADDADHTEALGHAVDRDNAATPSNRASEASPERTLTRAPPPAATVSWASARAAPATDETTRLLTALGHSPATLEILAARTDLEGATLQALLLQLELAGRIETLPGGRFVRIERS